MKALFVVPFIQGAREVVELHQRLDGDFEAVTCWRTDSLGTKNRYMAYHAGTSPEEKEAVLLGKLERDVDVVVLGNVRLAALSDKARDVLARKVAGGTGLVVFFGEDAGGDLFRDTTTAGRDWITDGVPLVGLRHFHGSFATRFPWRSVTELETRLLQTYRHAGGPSASHPGTRRYPCRCRD